jgi:hypothetical protein
MQITQAKPADRKGKKKRIRVVADKRKKSKTRKPRKMVAAPTLIGGIPIATLGKQTKGKNEQNKHTMARANGALQRGQLFVGSIGRASGSDRVKH